MLLDKLSTFANGVNFFGAAGTAKIGDSMPLGTTVRDLGEGYPLYFVALVSTAMTGGTSMQVNLVTADNDALTTNPVTLVSSAVITTANAVAGAKIIVVALPKADYKDFLGITVTRVGTSTVGALKAFLTQDPPNWRAYPEANS